MCLLTVIIIYILRRRPQGPDLQRHLEAKQRKVRLSRSLGVVLLQLVVIIDLHTEVDPDETGRSFRAPAGLVTSLKRQENTSDTKTCSCGRL